MHITVVLYVIFAQQAVNFTIMD